jgi:hypothetical protein
MGCLVATAAPRIFWFLMRKEVFEQRAAEMRARLEAERDGVRARKRGKPAERAVAAQPVATETVLNSQPRGADGAPGG